MDQAAVWGAWNCSLCTLENICPVSRKAKCSACGNQALRCSVCHFESPLSAELRTCPRCSCEVVKELNDDVSSRGGFPPDTLVKEVDSLEEVLQRRDRARFRNLLVEGKAIPFHASSPTLLVALIDGPRALSLSVLKLKRLSTYTQGNRCMYTTYVLSSSHLFLSSLFLSSLICLPEKKERNRRIVVDVAKWHH